MKGIDEAKAACPGGIGSVPDGPKALESSSQQDGAGNCPADGCAGLPGSFRFGKRNDPHSFCPINSRRRHLERAHPLSAVKKEPRMTIPFTRCCRGSQRAPRVLDAMRSWFYTLACGSNTTGWGIKAEHDLPLLIRYRERTQIQRASKIGGKEADLDPNSPRSF